MSLLLVGLAHAAPPPAEPVLVVREDLAEQVLATTAIPDEPVTPLRRMLRLESWRAPAVTDRASQATPFAFDPTLDHGTTWTDFELQRGIGYQAGLLPGLPEYDLGLTVSFTDGVRKRGRTSKAPQKLSSTVRGWIRDGIDAGASAVPELVADSMISAFGD